MIYGRIYNQMERNIGLLIDAMRRGGYDGWWDGLDHGLEAWINSDPGLGPKWQHRMERRAYGLMRKDNIRIPRRVKADSEMVAVEDKRLTLGQEMYSKRWLIHYYNLRHFQTCREIASFVSSRITGEYHNGHDLEFEEDLARLYAASKILGQRKTAAPSPAKSKDKK